MTVTNSDMLQINELGKINQRPTVHFILNFWKPCFMDTFKKKNFFLVLSLISLLAFYFYLLFLVIVLGITFMHLT
jgi:hypothetical protein